MLPAILTSFRDRHPGVIIELALSNHTEDLLRREADIAVRMVQPTQNALLSQKIGAVPFGLYAHRLYVERHGLPKTPREIRARPIIGFDRRPSLSPATLVALGLPTREMFALRTDSDLAGLAALRAGFGLCVCQRGLAARDPDLIAVDYDLLNFELGMWLVMHEDLKGRAPDAADV